MSLEHVLQLEHITMQFGGVVAVNDLSLEVNKGEIVSLSLQPRKGIFIITFN